MSATPQPSFGADLKKVFELWVSSDLKVEVVVFFHNNPGVIETVEGLATRLGITVDRLRPEIADQVRLGFLKERKMGKQTVLVYDRQAENHVQQFIADKLRTQRLREAA